MRALHCNIAENDFPGTYPKDNCGQSWCCGAEIGLVATALLVSMLLLVREYSPSAVVMVQRQTPDVDGAGCGINFQGE